MQPSKVYKLNVRLTIEELEVYSDGPPRYTNNRLEVSDAVDLGALDFMGVMTVLSQLHESIQLIGGKGK